MVPCQDIINLKCPGERLNLLPDGEITRCNFTFICSLFTSYYPLSLGNINNINPANKKDIQMVFYKLKCLKKMTLKNVLPYLKDQNKVDNFSSFILFKSNKVCFLRYRNERSIHNLYLCQKAFLEEIVKSHQKLLM